MSEKRAKGQYFTFKNPFNNQAFKDWGEKCDIKNSKILEPFAGKNSLIEMLEEMNLCQNFAAFDIEPKNQKVEIRDTLKNFPTGFKVCITNPPYLAQNSAKRRGLNFAECEFDDLYVRIHRVVYIFKNSKKSFTRIYVVVFLEFLSKYSSNFS
jgi:hypothetical protein